MLMEAMPFWIPLLALVAIAAVPILTRLFMRLERDEGKSGGG